VFLVRELKGDTMPTRILTGCMALALTALAAGADEARGRKVEYDVHNGHFVSNKFEVKDAAYVAITDKAGFDAIFGAARTMGKPPNFVPRDAFEKKMVVAVIKKGNAPVDYKVETVTADGDTLYVQYKAETKGATTATYASPLIVSVEKNKYKEVVFIENGKKVGTATVK
jgi:hypothetical protein